MLATLTEARFSDKTWIFEKKFDGVRALALRNGSELRLLSRNRLSFNSSYPDIVDRLQRQRLQRFIVDGEIVAMERGVSSFSRLQQRAKTVKPPAIYYFVFDLLYLNGRDTRDLPVLERKRLLRNALTFDERIRFVTHRVGGGEAYYEEACRKKWEGLIAKRAESLYVSGRSQDWLKFKCSEEQEFVIVGYTDPEGQRVGFGALLVGYYDDDRLQYAGKVGTGYTTETLLSLTKRLSKIERQTSAAQGIGLPRKNVHWVEPRLVAQIAFSEWTDDNKLRHPRFLGLREDKNARDVVRESLA